MKPEKEAQGWWARMSERRRDRRQMRAWRRERRKGFIDPSAASARSAQHAYQIGVDAPGQSTDSSGGS